MARVTNNLLIEGLSGTVGNIVFRQVNGKTVLSWKPALPQKQSEKQQENRLRFKAASAWAKATILKPSEKDHYKKRAKKLKLPNAYTAAIRDYMRRSNEEISS